jgi:hypothetical protein
MVVELERRADLLDHPGVEHHDLVGHGHRLDLVVGDVDHGVAEVLVELGDLDAHLHPELGVEVRQRLVEQEYPRLADDRPTDRDALAWPPESCRGLRLSSGSIRRISAARFTRGWISAFGSRADSSAKARFF